MESFLNYFLKGVCTDLQLWHMNVIKSVQSGQHIILALQGLNDEAWSDVHDSDSIEKRWPDSAMFIYDIRGLLWLMASDSAFECNSLNESLEGHEEAEMSGIEVGGLV